MKLTALTSPDDQETLSPRRQAGERLFALSATPQEAEALIHDLSGTIRTFRYIVSAYGDTLADDDPQKQQKLAQLDERLALLDSLKELLGPLAEDR